MALASDDTSHLGIVVFEDGPLTFETWFGKVSAEVVKITGLEAEDFADWGFADAFDDAVEPRQAAIDMLAQDSIGASFLELKGLQGEVSF